MDIELRDKWVAELRSGKYTQGTANLKYQEDGPDGDYLYCCLGVLCETAGIKSNQYENSNYVEFDGDDSILSENLLIQFGLTSEQQDFLAAMNDGSKVVLNDVNYDFSGPNKKNFNKIADWIEANL